jgi:hypothetical protein
MPQAPFSIVTSPTQGTKSVLNISAATLIEAGPGRIMQVVNNGAAVGFSAYDSATVAGAGAANLIYTSSATLAIGSVVTLDIPYTNGLVVTPISTGVVAVSYC